MPFSLSCREPKLNYLFVMGGHMGLEDEEDEDAEESLADSIRSMSEADQIRTVSKNGWLIFAIEDPSEAVQLAAVRDQPLVVMDAAVQMNDYLPDEDIDEILWSRDAYREAVRIRPDLIQSFFFYDDDFKRELYILAIRSDGYPNVMETVLKHEQLTAELQLLAVLEDPYNIEFVIGPDEATQVFLLCYEPTLYEQHVSPEDRAPDVQAAVSLAETMGMTLETPGFSGIFLECYQGIVNK